MKKAIERDALNGDGKAWGVVDESGHTIYEAQFYERTATHLALLCDSMPDATWDQHKSILVHLGCDLRDPAEVLKTLKTVMVKVANLCDAALDWAVAVSEKRLEFPDNPINRPESYTYRPSTNFAQGGPIFEREISNYEKRDGYFYCNKFSEPRGLIGSIKQPVWMHGSTLLEAGMRCYVASKLGMEIQVPVELMPAVINKQDKPKGRKP